MEFEFEFESGRFIIENTIRFNPRSLSLFKSIDVILSSELLFEVDESKLIPKSFNSRESMLFEFENEFEDQNYLMLNINMVKVFYLQVFH